MLTLWGVLTAITVGGGLPIVGGLWMFERRRSRRRNRSGRCASCGISWRSTPAAEPYLIHGRLVCDGCAEKTRRHLPWHFGALGLAAAVATGFTLAGGNAVVMTLFPLGSTVVMTAGAVQLMKRANRRAQRRIATGEFPDMETLGSGSA